MGYTSSAGTYNINFSGVTGTPDKLIYTIVGGGGSGAAGTIAGNDGGDSTITIGTELVLVAGGGKKGNPSSGQTLVELVVLVVQHQKLVHLLVFL